MTDFPHQTSDVGHLCVFPPDFVRGFSTTSELKRNFLYIGDYASAIGYTRVCHYLYSVSFKKVAPTLNDI